MNFKRNELQDQDAVVGDTITLGIDTYIAAFTPEPLGCTGCAGEPWLCPELPYGCAKNENDNVWFIWVKRDD